MSKRQDREIARLHEALKESEANNDRIARAWRVADESGPLGNCNKSATETIAEVRALLASIEARIASGEHAEVERYCRDDHDWGGYNDVRLRLRIGFIMGG